MSNFERTLDVAIPVITFFLTMVVGMDLSADDFKQIQRSSRAFAIGTLVQYLLPFCALAIFKVMRPAPAIAAGMVMLAAAPAGGISNYYSYLARVNMALSVVLTAVSCLAAAVTMPLLLHAFEFVLSQRIDFHVPLRLLMAQLLLLLVAPVLIGTILRRYRPEFVSKYDRIFRRLGLAGLAALLAFVLFQTRDVVAANWQGIAQTAAVFILISMALGYFTGFAFGLSRDDSFTLLIQCGVRNVAITSTAAVVILRRVDFAIFAAIYFVVEAFLILTAVVIFRRASD